LRSLKWHFVTLLTFGVVTNPNFPACFECKLLIIGDNAAEHRAKNAAWSKQLQLFSFFEVASNRLTPSVPHNRFSFAEFLQSFCRIA
jgi:hypothetical protein